jgi:hypothetical protein
MLRRVTATSARIGKVCLCPLGPRNLNPLKTTCMEFITKLKRVKRDVLNKGLVFSCLKFAMETFRNDLGNAATHF